MEERDSILATVGVEIDWQDPILFDEARLKRAAAVFEAHGDALRDVFSVSMRSTAHEMVHSAPDEMTLFLRHQIAGKEDVFLAFRNYHTEYLKRVAAAQAVKDAKDKPAVDTPKSSM